MRLEVAAGPVEEFLAGRAFGNFNAVVNADDACAFAVRLLSFL